MAWVWLDDQMPDHPKVARLTPTQSWAFVAGLCYCSRMRTDGFIPSSVAWRLYSTDSGEAEDEPVRVAETLVAAGLWERAAGGYAVHDYLDYQPSRDALARSHKSNRERQKRYRQHRNGVTNGVSNGVQKAVLGTKVTGTPTPNSKDQDQDHRPAGAVRAMRPVEKSENPKALLRLAHDVLAQEPETGADAADLLKTAASRAHLAYTSRAIGAALEQAHVQRHRAAQGPPP